MRNNHHWIDQHLHGDPPKDRDYMTPSELHNVKVGREAGSLSIFKLIVCAREGCKKQIITAFKFCSRECSEGEQANE